MKIHPKGASMLFSSSAGRMRPGVGMGVYAVTVAVLLAVAASGFVLYGTRPQAEATTTVTSTESASAGSSAMSASAVRFVPAHGQMFGDGWLIVAPLGSGDYSMTVHATGLEPGAMGTYIVEATQSSAQMAVVPVAGSNATLSEFMADAGGNGDFFTILMSNPSSDYESVSIVYLPGMMMDNATVVATASLAM